MIQKGGLINMFLWVAMGIFSGAGFIFFSGGTMASYVFGGMVGGSIGMLGYEFRRKLAAVDHAFRTAWRESRYERAEFVRWVRGPHPYMLFGNALGVFFAVLCSTVTPVQFIAVYLVSSFSVCAMLSFLVIVAVDAVDERGFVRAWGTWVPVLAYSPNAMPLDAYIVLPPGESFIGVDSGGSLECFSRGAIPRTRETYRLADQALKGLIVVVLLLLPFSIPRFIFKVVMRFIRMAWNNEMLFLFASSALGAGATHTLWMWGVLPADFLIADSIGAIFFSAMAVVVKVVYSTGSKVEKTEIS